MIDSQQSLFNSSLAESVPICRRMTFFACCSSSNGNAIAVTERERMEFTYKELAKATSKFSMLLREGEFGKVYQGILPTGEMIAVKKLSHGGEQDNRVFELEMRMLSQLSHRNLVKLIGYCTSVQKRLLVFEYMPLGSLEDRLFRPKPGQEALDWQTRLRIAIGAARGLEYLHCHASPPVVHRDLMSANILLDDGFNAKLGPVGDRSDVRGTQGYLAPDYVMSGHLTLKTDIYSFGVVLLELISGRRAIFRNTDGGLESLVYWAKSYLNNPMTRTNLVDPLLLRQFSTPTQLFNLRNVIGLAADCLKEHTSDRPVIRYVVATLKSAY